jgi:Zn-dependent protease
MLDSDTQLKRFIIAVVVIVVSISLHEFGHAISADRLGDDTPRRQGRITLWPDKHFDPLGFIMILVTCWFGFGLGWGKPVMVNPRNFQHPRRDMIIVAAFGPLMNLLLALVFGLILRVFIQTGHGDIVATVPGRFMFSFVLINLSLMFFNLIPLHPLDGSKILSGLLPVDLAIQYDRFFGQWGPMIIMLCVLSGRGIIGSIILPAVLQMFRLIVGNF